MGNASCTGSTTFSGLVLVGLLLAACGGGPATTNVGVGTTEEADELTASPAEPTGDVGVESAVMPPEFSYVATKTGGNSERPVGQSYLAQLVLTGGCSGDVCSYTTPLDIGAATPRSPVTPGTWERDGEAWRLTVGAALLSASYAPEVECVLDHTQTWELQVTDTRRDGDRLVATAWQGGMTYRVSLNEELSQGGIDGGYCPVIVGTNDWTDSFDVVANIDWRLLPEAG